MELDPQPISDESIRAIRNRLAIYRQPSHNESTCDDDGCSDHGTPVWMPDTMERLLARLDAAESTLAEAHPLAPDDELRAENEKLREALREIANASRDDGLAAMCNWMRGRALAALTQ